MPLFKLVGISINNLKFNQDRLKNKQNIKNISNLNYANEIINNILKDVNTPRKKSPDVNLIYNCKKEFENKNKELYFDPLAVDLFHSLEKRTNNILGIDNKRNYPSYYQQSIDNKNWRNNGKNITSEEFSINNDEKNYSEVDDEIKEINNNKPSEYENDVYWNFNTDNLNSLINKIENIDSTE